MDQPRYNSFSRQALTHVTRRPIEVTIPDPVYHYNLGKVAVPALITPRLFVP